MLYSLTKAGRLGHRNAGQLYTDPRLTGDFKNNPIIDLTEHRHKRKYEGAPFFESKAVLVP
jgi:hypothetical protein